jgi:hypothetical protein
LRPPVPRHRICVTARAQLGFHAALARNELGQLVPNPAATEVLYAYYPSFIKVWLSKRGGLGAETMIMQSDVLRQFYAVVTDKHFAAGKNCIRAVSARFTDSKSSRG